MSPTIARSDDLALCLRLRRRVFIEEQGVPEADEVDGRDHEAVHLLARVGGEAVGCARLLTMGTTGKIGRVCVLPAWRGGVARRWCRRRSPISRPAAGLRGCASGRRPMRSASMPASGLCPRGRNISTPASFIATWCVRSDPRIRAGCAPRRLHPRAGLC